MQLSAKFAILAGFMSFASAATLSKRVDTTQHCGLWDSVVAGPYTLYLNQWGHDGAQSGSDCANIVSLNGNSVAWANTWQWNGGNGVKSYTNINLNDGMNKQLSSISRIPATWNWSQNIASGSVANTAFDLFTTSSPGGKDEYEIMVWVDNVNAGPISYQYGADGKPVPIATGLNIAGQTWNLYYGTNGINYVYSFLSGRTINNFSGDLNEFLKYLTSKQNLNRNQYLKTLQAGTEATSGRSTFNTYAYSVSVQ